MNTWERFNTSLAAILLVFLVMFLGVIGSTLIGGFIGYVVGWFFANPILGIFEQMGIHGWTMFEIGAFLGFVGGFFRTYVSSK